MKKKTKIFLVVLLVVAVALCAVAYFLRDTISVVKTAVENDSETLEQLVIQQKQTTEEALKSVGLESINPLNSEDLEKLKNGEITEEEAIKSIIGQDTAQPPAESKPEDDDKQYAIQQEANSKVAKLIGKLYVLKAQFESELAGLEGSIISQYTALPPEKHTYSEKVKLGRQALATATSLEASCDSQVYAILDEVEAILSNAKMDTSTVASIKSAYQSEKKITKSYYLDKYLK